MTRQQIHSDIQEINQAVARGLDAHLLAEKYPLDFHTTYSGAYTYTCRTQYPALAELTNQLLQHGSCACGFLERNDLPTPCLRCAAIHTAAEKLRAIK